MRRVGDQFKKPSIQDSVIQKPYYCEHVWRLTRDAVEIRKSATAVVYLCRDCKHKDYRLADNGKVVIVE